MIFPVKGVEGKDYKITTEFNAAHPGIDIAPIPAGKSGVECLAPEAGVIVASASRPSLEGNYIILHGMSGRFYYFGHFAKRLVGVAATVKAGQPIGILGMTGRATGVHTHFEVRPGRDSVNQINPRTLFKKEQPVTSEQILTSRPVFRPDYYLKVNRDVARHKNTQAYALEHWLEYGVKEGRPSAPNFHVKEYMANYGDLRRTYGTNYQKAVNHYFVHGINEGRAGRKKTTVQVVDRTSELKNKIIDFVKGLK